MLERALAYARGALASIAPDDLSRTTPCTAWLLSDLLAHLEDSLDAFIEGATGIISLRRTQPTPPTHRVASVQAKACELLGAWTWRPAAVAHDDAADDDAVTIGGQRLPVDTIAHLAALEITVHGWDVACSTGYDAPPPAALADRLLATALTAALEQGKEFAPPRPVSVDADPATRLLALVGRTR